MPDCEQHPFTDDELKLFGMDNRDARNFVAILPD